MTARGNSSRVSRPGLTEDDEQLWAQVTEKIVPVRSKTRRDRTDTREPRSAPSAASESELSRPATVRPRTGAAKPLAPLADVDRRTARRLAKGQREIEARLDLHGMRQSEAHSALRSFLFSCHANGCRTVLVITGKGASDRESAFQAVGERGVLKRNVPRWLAGPELGAIVAGYGPAHVRHGGAGALYVQLRRRRSG